MIHDHQLLRIGLRLALVLSIACSGCGNSDVTPMKTMANKISSAVNDKMVSGDYVQARNLALASCIFAREINCVQGKPPLTPTPDLAMKITEPPGDEAKRTLIFLGGSLVSLGDAWKTIQETALQANKEIKGIDRVTYDDILKSALSEAELQQLQKLRAAKLYWAEQIEPTLR